MRRYQVMKSDEDGAWESYVTSNNMVYWLDGVFDQWQDAIDWVNVRIKADEAAGSVT